MISKLTFGVLIVITYSSFATAQSSWRNETKCDRLLTETDKCIGSLMFIGARTVNVARDESELESYCAHIKSNLPCFKNYGRKCLKSLPRTLFTIGSKSAGNLFKKFCETPAGRREFIKHARCMQPEQISIVHQYLDLITAYLDYAADNVTDVDKIIPTCCCAYFKVYEDAVAHLHKLCDKVTGPETAPWTMNIVRSIAYDMIDLTCGRYSSTKACTTHLPDTMKVFVNMATPFDKIARKEYTPIIPVLKIIKRLDNGV